MKLLLVADRREALGERAPTGIRRYRLARLRLDSRQPGPEAPFEYLKRVYE